MTTTTPKPGSPAAIKAGCICPVMDNANGMGLPDGTYWMRDDCPLHGEGTHDRPL